MICMISNLNKGNRQLLSENKESEILELNCLHLLTPEKIKAFDESYLINFAPLIDLTIKLEGQS